MAIIREAIVFLVMSCIAATVAGQSQDGLPRPDNVPVEPTTSYGMEPEVKYADLSPVGCEWYGFANELYDASVGETCLKDLRAALLNVTGVSLEPFVYYFHRGQTGADPATEEPFCFQGCFILNAGALPPDSGAFPPNYFDTPASPPESYIRGPSLAPFYWPGAPPVADLAPPPASGDEN